MATLRIYDLDDRGALAVSLARLLDLLAPQSLQAEWTVSPVEGREPGQDGFEATGPAGEQLETLAARNAVVSGTDLAALAGGIPVSAANPASLTRSPAPATATDPTVRAHAASPASLAPTSGRATNVPQIIWGQFVARLPGESGPWLTLRAIDSSFYEVETEDDAVHEMLRATFKDFR